MSGRALMEWQGRIIATLYKSKDWKTDCNSYLPITSLSVPGKVFVHVLLDRSQPLFDRLPGRNCPYLHLADPLLMQCLH